MYYCRPADSSERIPPCLSSLSLTMEATTQVHSDYDTTFISHLIAVLNVYELGIAGVNAAKPVWQGPDDWRFKSIVRQLDSIIRRVYTAESVLESLRAGDGWDPAATKKRRTIAPVSNGTNGFDANGATPAALAPNPPSFFPPYPLDSLIEHDEHDVSMPDFPDPDDLAHTTVPFRNTASAPPAPTGAVPPRERPEPSPMSISLHGVSSLDAAIDRNFAKGTSSAPPTGLGMHGFCPTCHRPATDLQMLQKLKGSDAALQFIDDPASPMLVPPGPLATAAYESGMSAVDELRLLKDQIKDVASVCSAVARGDLSKKVTVPVHGVVMVELKEVINLMVENLAKFSQEVTRVSVEVGTEGYASQIANLHRLKNNIFPLANSVDRLSSSMSKAPGASSRTSSTTWPPISPTKCAPSPPSPKPSPTATSQNRSTCTRRERSST
jgi:hypothetical protein